MMDSAVDETLAWLNGLDFAVSPAVVEKARLLLLDTIACATAGFAEPELRALVGQLGDEGSRVCWPGMAQPLGAAAATYVATVAACWHEACEGLAQAHGRPGLHAIPPALSVGLAGSLPLGRILDAIVWGYEFGARFGEAMRIRPGLHVDGTWGALGAAAAAMRIAGGDQARVRDAMATAACQIPMSLYLPIAEGHTTRNLYAAQATAAAVLRARATASGIGSPRGAFDVAASLLSGNKDGPRAWTEPGRFLLLDAYTKPFAAVRHVHYPAAAAIALRRAHDIDPATIEDVEIRTYQEALVYCGNRAPRAAIQAQFSLSYGTVFALRTGGLGPEAYTDDALNDAVQRSLEQRVVLVADPSLTARAARVTVRAGGQTLREHAGPVKGDPSLPMDASDVIDKAVRYMTSVIGEAEAAAVVRAVLETPLACPLDLRFGPAP